MEEENSKEIKEPRDKYLPSLLQEDDDEDDDSLDYSSTSVNKYKIKFSYKDFSISFIFPCYRKPIIDKDKGNVDLIFELLVNRATHFFFLATDENYREQYKTAVKTALDYRG